MDFRVSDDGTPVVSFDEDPVVIFVPHDDDSFATTSHHCRAIVEAPGGVWLFSERVE